MTDPTRAEHLAQVSGLRVEVRREKNEEVYEFYRGKEPVKTVFTYRKAKVFAQGVEIGRKFTSRPKRWWQRLI
jgi:hypothetical protein